MKAMFAAFATMIVIAIAAPFILEQIGFSAADRTTSTAVRID
ncbi:hypothetical protein ACXYMO_04225 [Arenibacterium sp. CAU 1754]